MIWVAVLKLLFQVANALTAYLHDKQLMDAGQAKQMSADLLETLDGIQKAHAARLAVRSDPDSVRDDPDNVDTHANAQPPLR